MVTKPSTKTKAGSKAVAKPKTKASAKVNAKAKSKPVVARKKALTAGRPVGSSKLPTTIRLDADVLAALQASGKGWQTRVNALLSDWVRGGYAKASV